MAKGRNQILRFALSLLLLPLSLFAEGALNGGLKGSGRILSAIPAEPFHLQADFAFSRVSGSDLGLKDVQGNKIDAGDALMKDYSLALGYGILNYLEAGLFIPFYQDITPENKSSSGLGDLVASLKINYPPYPHKKGYELSYLLRLHLPSGSANADGYTRHVWNLNNEDNSAQKPFSADGPVLELRLLNSVDLSALGPDIKMHLNWGLAVSKQSHENAFLIGGGLEYAPIRYVNIFWGFDSEVNVRATRKSIPFTSYPIRSSIGIAGNIPEWFVRLGAGMDFAINPNDSLLALRSGAIGSAVGMSKVPARGFFFEIGTSIPLLPLDSDHDGIIDKKDACPNEPEDKDGYEDTDGCPDLDNDMDSIPDKLDKCPSDAEDRDGFQDEDGCPDLDNDRDGIPDLKDGAPNEAEDKDGFQDEDGISEPDNDNDGILDAQDRCPNEAEDKDGYQDGDGCPDLDNDQDGIADALDKCPNQAENKNGIEDQDGCPDEDIPRLSPAKNVVPGLEFKTGTAELTFSSVKILDNIVTSLQAYPKDKVQFWVFAKRVGGETKTQTLTEAQADVLRNYLVSKGVSRNQISSQGMGSKSGIEGKNIYRVEMQVSTE